MPKINLLDSIVYNKISAGEVVEGPCSVVKELVENSIDSGCSRVKIAIEGGGIDYIEVQDNGCGIDEEDMAMAFMQHATSKVYSIKDLFEIETLGFRGEALASIASVADVSMTSRTPYVDTATRIDLENGVVVNKTYNSSNIGTKVQVSGLFSNVPARLKFLKSAKQEAKQVTQYVSKLILTNCFLEVTYTIDGVEIFNTKGEGLEEAIFAVYGSDCLNNCIPINAEYHGITVKGYIGTPMYAKANTTYQTISVNGRYVKDTVISSAVKQAFMSFLTVRSYPLYVLDVAIDNSLIDVNVHPSKMEVRFENSRDVFVAVSYPIKEALKRFSQKEVQRILENNDQQDFRIDDVRPVETTPLDTFVPMDIPPERDLSRFANRFESFSDRDIYSIKSNINNEIYTVEESADDIINYNNTKIPEGSNAYRDTHCANGAVMPDVGTFDNLFDLEIDPKKKALPYDLSNVTIFGTYLKTYLLLQVNDNLLIIDQHAAHERIIYDKLITSNYTSNSYFQGVLMCEVFTVTPEESQFIDENLEAIRNTGIEIDTFGDCTYRLSNVSIDFINCEPRKLIDSILSCVHDTSFSGGNIVRERLALRACKSAVKAGTPLSDNEIETLLIKLFENSNLQCPHGRPIIVQFDKNQMEKMFKRKL